MRASRTSLRVFVRIRVLYLRGNAPVANVYFGVMFSRFAGRPSFLSVLESGCKLLHRWGSGVFLHFKPAYGGKPAIVPEIPCQFCCSVL
jgi:hypothetical protein